MFLDEGLELKSDTAEPPRRSSLPSRQQFFPIMKLPTEVRFMIYAIALEQTIDHAISSPFGTPRLMSAPAFELYRLPNSNLTSLIFPATIVTSPQVVGALAFLHTNRELRSESASEFMRLALTHVRVLGERH